MKAFVTQNPGLENASVSEIRSPVAGPGEVLVHVKASALNHLDLWVASGHPSYRVQYPHVLGSDGAGVIEAFGPGVQAEVGQRVVILPMLYCGSCDACIRGLVGSCDRTATIGAQTWGTHAEYTVVPKQNVFPIENLTYEQAACLPVGALTAYHLLRMADAQKGQSVLVWGASSSVGSFAIQIAKHLGLTVISTASTTKTEHAAEVFGVPIIDYQKKEVSQGVRELTANRGVDIVMEIVGPATWEKSAKSVRKGGCIVACGAVSGPDVNVELRWLYSNQVRIQGSKIGTPQEFAEVLKLAESGAIKPIIESRYPLSDAPAALKQLAEGKAFGKVVLTR